MSENFEYDATIKQQIKKYNAQNNCVGDFPYFIKNRILRKFSDRLIEYLREGGNTPDEDDTKKYNLEDPDNITNMFESCHLICSDMESNMHLPVLDLDFSCVLVDSSTEGHYHLYINKEVEWDKYQKLLLCLAECGIIEEGYANASIARGYSAVRKPGLKKGDIAKGKL
jgi:hypothetical protein